MLHSDQLKILEIPQIIPPQLLLYIVRREVEKVLLSLFLGLHIPQENVIDTVRDTWIQHHLLPSLTQGTDNLVLHWQLIPHPN